MTWLDRMIGLVSPERAERRLRARAMTRTATFDQVRMAYDAARVSKRSAGWRAVPTDPNTEVAQGGMRLREIARDMVRNNPHASRGVQVISEGIVGAGIIPNVQCSIKPAKDRMEALITQHCDSTDIDADGRHNLYGLQNLVARSVPEAGEVLIRYRPRPAADRFALPFQLQVLEADFLDKSKDGPLANGGWTVQGIEFDANGRRVAYNLYRQHPGSIVAWRLPESVRVPAEYVAHVYRVDRPGQVNGVSWFAPVIMGMRDFADYEDAPLIRQKIAACFAAFITSTDGATPGALTGEDSEDTDLPLEAFEPGMIERLRPGEDVKFGTPPLVEGYRDISVVTLHKIAVGLGIDYASLTGDNSESNFANSRMGWLRFHRSIESWQWNMVIPSMCDPVGRWILDGTAAVMGTRPPAHILWTPPRREMFDPSKDTKAAIEAIAGGLSSRSAEIRKLGYDPVELDAEIDADNQRADASKSKMRFTSDGRHAVKAGNIKDQTNDA